MLPRNTGQMLAIREVAEVRGRRNIGELKAPAPISLGICYKIEFSP